MRGRETAEVRVLGEVDVVVPVDEPVVDGGKEDENGEESNEKCRARGPARPADRGPH